MYNSFYYRPQTMFAKVMFSQVSVCPQVGVYPSMHLVLAVYPSMHWAVGFVYLPGGVCPGGCLPGGVCLGGCLSRGRHPP